MGAPAQTVNPKTHISTSLFPYCPTPINTLTMSVQSVMDVLRDIQANPTDAKAMEQLVKQVSALEAASKTPAQTTKTLTPPMLPADDEDTEMETDKPFVTPLSPPNTRDESFSPPTPDRVASSPFL